MPATFEQANTLRDALAAGIAFEGFHRQCRVLTMANLAQVVNVLQAVVMTDGATCVKTPTYHALAMHRPHMGAEALQVEVATDSAGPFGGPALSATASGRPGRAAVTVINREYRGSVTVTIRAAGAVTSSWLLTAASPDAGNDPANPGASVAAASDRRRLSSRAVHRHIATALDGRDRVRHKRSKSRLMAARSPKRVSAEPRRHAAARGARTTEQDGSVRGSVAPARPARIPTMQDIADAAGVSQSTVSRVLTGAPNAIPINPATRERILEVARQMRYRPNPLARGLRGARTMLLGVIVREITDPFFAGAVDAISTEANRRGYNVVLGDAHGHTDEAIALRAVLETRHCDAILLLGDTSDQPRLMEDLRDTNVPVVGLWQGTARMPGISVVGVDNKFGLGGLMDHLLGLGHRKIAFVGGVFVEGRLIGDIGERRAAFLERATAEGLETPDGFVRDARNTLSGGAGALRELMALPERPTAIIASTDVLAIGALHAAAHMGLHSRRDLDSGLRRPAMAEYTTPALTTVCMPIAEMAAAGVKAAIDEGQDREATTLQILKPTVVVRESSGRAPDRDR